MIQSLQYIYFVVLPSVLVSTRTYGRLNFMQLPRLPAGFAECRMRSHAIVILITCDYHHCFYFIFIPNPPKQATLPFGMAMALNAPWIRHCPSPSLSRDSLPFASHVLNQIQRQKRHGTSPDHPSQFQELKSAPASAYLPDHPARSIPPPPATNPPPPPHPAPQNSTASLQEHIMIANSSLPEVVRRLTEQAEAAENYLRTRGRDLVLKVGDIQSLNPREGRNFVFSWLGSDSELPQLE